jgi:restriction system protein
MEYYLDDIIDGNSLTLDEYLDMLLNGNFRKIYPNNCFPNNGMLEEYTSRINTYKEFDIKKVLFRFLVHGGSYGKDKWTKEFLKNNKENINAINEQHPIYLRRLIKNIPWEGITWIIDLLPNFPKDAINVVDSFFKIYCQILPDDVLVGLSEVNEIIRARYYNNEQPINILKEMTPYEFEALIAALYNEMGYDTQLTKKSHDDGVDVIANGKNIGHKELLFIQCKKYKSKINVKDIRELLGIIEVKNATKGVFCTTSDYTYDARKFSIKTNRIELLNGKVIVKLCNEYLGTKWPIRISTYLFEYENKKK